MHHLVVPHSYTNANATYYRQPLFSCTLHCITTPQRTLNAAKQTNADSYLPTACPRV